MKTQKGQILIVTLLVLTILAIVVVSLVSLVGKDATQVTSTQQYSDAYNTAETQLKKILTSYSKPGTNLAQITTTFNSTTDLNCAQTSAAQKIYTCSVNSSDFSKVPLQTSITVQDTNNITGFSVYKDRSLDLDLSGYVGTLNFSWDKNAAIEFELVYKDASGAYQSISDDEIKILDELEFTLNNYSLLKEQLDIIEDKIYDLNNKLF